MAFLCHFFQNEHPLSAGIKILDLQNAFTHINCNYRFKILHLASHNFPKMAFFCHSFQNEHPSSAGIKILDMEKDFSHMNTNSVL